MHHLEWRSSAMQGRSWQLVRKVRLARSCSWPILPRVRLTGQQAWGHRAWFGVGHTLVQVQVPKMVQPVKKFVEEPAASQGSHLGVRCMQEGTVRCSEVAFRDRAWRHKSCRGVREVFASRALRVAATLHHRVPGLGALFDPRKIAIPALVS